MSFTSHRRTRRAAAVLALALSAVGTTVSFASIADAATPPAATETAYPNDLVGWIAQAQAVLAADGDQVPSADAITARAMTESSGNPAAQNHWDANQALYGGTYGLMQLIQPTFDQYALPGHTDIMNPVDSIIASVRYANATYGSFDVIAYTQGGY